MKKIRFTPAFVKTKNVRNFEVLMDGLELGAGEGRLGKVTGRAGLGKTRTCQWYAAHHGCVYMRVIISGIPRRRGAMFYAIVDHLTMNPRPVFLDELERVRPRMVDLVRDLSDVSTAPFVLIGEEELDTVMRRNRRTWSRTFQAMEFEPVAPADIVFYLKESAELNLDAALASYMHQKSSGDWRLVKSAALSLVQQVNANGQPEITKQMMENSFAVSLGGGRNGRA
jgi:hypothetical protein